MLSDKDNLYKEEIDSLHRFINTAREQLESTEHFLETIIDAIARFQNQVMISSPGD